MSVRIIYWLTKTIEDAAAEIASRHLDGFQEDVPFNPEMEEKCTTDS